VYQNELATESTFELIDQIQNDIESCLAQLGVDIPELAARLNGQQAWILVKSGQAANCTILKNFKYVKFNLLFHTALDHQTKQAILIKLYFRLRIKFPLIFKRKRKFFQQ